LLFLDMRRARLGGQAVPSILPTVHDFRQHDMAPLSRRAVRARVLREGVSLWEQRAQGRPGARRHPWPPCMKKHGEGTTGVGGVIRPSLRNGFTAYTRSPRGPTGDRACLPRHTQALSEPLARLAPASGRQDHTISPSATRTSQEATRRFRYPSADTPYEGAFSTPVAHCPRPSHPASNVRDDREAPLVIEAGQR
jgi:hypothetical protein